MKKFYLFMLMAVGLLISGNSWANYFMPEIEGKPVLKINENVTLGEEVVPTVNIASENAAPQRIAKSPMEVTIHQVSTEDDLIQALTSATAGDEIKLTEDIALTSGITIAKQLTLNLGGKTLSGSASPLITVTGGPLTIVGNSDGETPLGTIASSFASTSVYGFVIRLEKSQLIFTSGTISASTSFPRAIYVYGGSKVTIGENANISCAVEPSYNAGHIYNATNGASFENSSTIDLFNPASATITNHGTLNVRGAGSYGANSITNDGTITFYGGTFDGSLKALLESNLAQGLLLIKTLLSGKDAYVVASSLASVVATVGDYQFTSLQDAILASTDAVPAVLQKDVSQGSDVTINKDVNPHTLDMNNHNITFTSDYDFTLNYKAKLTITGTGTITVNSKYNAFYILGLPKGYPGENIVITIGENVTVNNIYSSTSGETTTKYYVFGILPYNNGNYANGIVINFNGKNKEGFFATVLGNITAQDESVPVFNVGPKAEIEDIYAAGFAKWTIDGKMNDQFEIRAGELTINSGEITGNDEKISSVPNGSGGTAHGAAVAVAQHTTKEPIVVTINGGKFEGLMALIQTNPQNNNEEDYMKLKVNVYGGYFKSTHTEGGTLYENVAGYGTVTYAADAMCISQNKRIFLMGGFYNYDPVEFVATGYKRYPITTEDYPTEYAAGYRYRIGEIDQAGEQKTTVSDGDWKTQATTVWQQGESAGTEPTDETPVVIENDKQVIVTTPATAYSVTLGTGTSKLTVKETGRLMVGAGGVNGTTEQSFIVEDGGQMAISPATNDYQPEATVELTVDWARRKAAADDKAQGDLVASDLYWQHIATPLSDGTAPTLSQTGVSYVNTWNLINGWTAALTSNIVSPFVGYQISSINKSTDDKITYTFKGQLVGNHVDPMTFTRIGFSFFGNSYLAPIDIRELLTCLESKGAVDPTVLLYDSENGVYNSINRASFYIPGTKAEIQPLQGFFVFAESATNVDFDYRKAVWDAFCAKAATPAMAPATAPAMQENPFSAIACIDIKAANGAADRVMLFEGDEMSDAEDKGYDAHKMMTSGVNIYAKGSYADLAILATNNLLNSQLVLKTDANTNYTLSFANIKGEYALYDALTGRTINMVEGATYDFEAQSNATITDRFYVVEAAKAPTTMENVDAQAGSCKFMKNGIMFIERNNKVYNAQGQIVK